MTTAGARRLVVAMLLRAVRDAQGDSLLAAPARRWLADEGAAWAEWLGLDPGKLGNFLTNLDPPRQPALL